MVKARTHTVLGVGLRRGSGMQASVSLLVPGGVIFFLELVQVDGDLVAE